MYNYLFCCQDNFYYLSEIINQANYFITCEMENNALINRLLKHKKITIFLLLLAGVAIYKFGTIIGAFAYLVLN